VKLILGACHWKYPSFQIAVIPLITFGVEDFLYFEHKYWVQQFHGTKNLGF
jgi:hypothetical protein